jgi:hypothetical protein
MQVSQRLKHWAPQVQSLLLIRLRLLATMSKRTQAQVTVNMVVEVVQEDSAVKVVLGVVLMSYQV